MRERRESSILSSSSVSLSIKSLDLDYTVASLAYMQSIVHQSFVAFAAVLLRWRRFFVILLADHDFDGRDLLRQAKIGDLIDCT